MDPESINSMVASKEGRTLIAIDAEIVADLVSLLKETQLELSKVREQQQGNIPLTLKEAAAYLHVSYPTLREYIRLSEIVPSEFGNRVWIIRSELDAFIARHRRKTFQ